MFDVGGHQLFIDCQGTATPGSPTVVLDAGLGVDSGTWARVQPLLTGVTRVCRYDRAGLGRSEPGPMPRTSQQMVEELRALLEVTGLQPPYILAGASFGGLNAQLYAIQYPDEVVGMALVDSLHPDFDVRIEQLFTPEQVAERRAELASNLEGLTFDDILTSQTQVREAGLLPDVPLVVLRHGRPFEFSPGWPAEEVEALWVDLPTDLASRSTDSQLIVADRAGHRIHEMRPDLVIQALKDLVAKTQNR
jgi:pimeloyl-ACP methyl ester carboxylesterase